MTPHESQPGRLPRPIPAAITEFTQLLARGVSASVLQPIVAELEAGHADVYRNIGVAVQYEANAANMMVSIRRTLSDPRLRELGITSGLAYPEEEN